LIYKVDHSSLGEEKYDINMRNFGLEDI